MSILMVLEIEVGFGLDGVFSALNDMGEAFFEDGKLVGNFSFSNAYFVFNAVAPPQAVTAEESGQDWEVGIRGAIHCSNDRIKECWRDIHDFLELLDRVMVCRFVLSFQYESIYAVRDKTGLRFLKSMLV